MHYSKINNSNSKQQLFTNTKINLTLKIKTSLISGVDIKSALQFTMQQKDFNNDNSKRKFVRWRAAIIPKHHAQAFEGKIIAANSDSLILLSATAFKPGSEARFMLEVFEYNGAQTTKNQLDLTGKIIDSALIGHISLFRHKIQLQTPNHQQQQLLNKLTQQ